MVATLLAAGADPGSVTPECMEGASPEAKEVLREARRRKVKPLAQLCRVAVWRRFGAGTVRKVERMGLPGVLVNFLGYDW